jgi:hypothetical protein
MIDYTRIKKKENSLFEDDRNDLDNLAYADCWELTHSAELCDSFNLENLEEYYD